MERIDEIVERLISDAAFKRQVITDPKGALAGYQLNQTDLEFLARRLGEAGADQAATNSALAAVLQSSGGLGEAESLRLQMAMDRVTELDVIKLSSNYNTPPTSGADSPIEGDGLSDTWEPSEESGSGDGGNIVLSAGGDKDSAVGTWTLQGIMRHEAVDSDTPHGDTATHEVGHYPPMASPSSGGGVSADELSDHSADQVAGFKNVDGLDMSWDAVEDESTPAHELGHAVQQGSDAETGELTSLRPQVQKDHGYAGGHGDLSVHEVSSSPDVPAAPDDDAVPTRDEVASSHPPTTESPNGDPTLDIDDREGGYNLEGTMTHELGHYSKPKPPPPTGGGSSLHVDDISLMDQPGGGLTTDGGEPAKPEGETLEIAHQGFLEDALPTKADPTDGGSWIVDLARLDEMPPQGHYDLGDTSTHDLGEPATPKPPQTLSAMSYLPSGSDHGSVGFFQQQTGYPADTNHSGPVHVSNHWRRRVLVLALVLVGLAALFLTWRAFGGAEPGPVPKLRLDYGVDNDVKVTQRQADARGGSTKDKPPVPDDIDEVQVPPVADSAPSQPTTNDMGVEPEQETSADVRERSSRDPASNDSSDTSARDRQRDGSDAGSDSTSTDEPEATDRGGR